ncbi:MAG TPA: hypothetical protein VFV95_03785 [Vicinamibacterales bacterium]|nr:hypothetical protein [Vicinamibacterales bacterium]
MSKRTRVFVLVASAVLVVGLGTAGVASYMGVDGLGLFAAGASDELAYVPAGTEVIGFADVRQVLDSELGTRLQSRLIPPSQETQDNVFTQTGIDIRKDVDSVVVASLRGEAAGEMPLMLARGEFDQPRIESLLVSRGGEVSHHQNIRIVTLNQPEVGIGFLEARLVAVGNPAAVRLAVDTKTAGTGSVKDDAELMRLVHRVDNGNTWTVARFDALQRRQQFPAQLAAQLPAITWFAASGQIGSGVSATLLAEAKDDQAAQNLREVIRGLLALARMQLGQQPDLASFVNSVELTGEGNTVSVAFSLPRETLDKLTALGAQRPAPPSGVSGRPLAPSNVRPRTIPSI